MMTDDEYQEYATADVRNTALKDILKKIEGSLLPTISDHLDSNAQKDCLDFFDVKNSILLSYIIDLIQNNLLESGGSNCESGSPEERLLEMKIALERIRPLEKKMKYQLDKLLSENSNSARYAINGTQQDDPLLFRPNAKAMNYEEKNCEPSSSSESGNESDENDVVDREYDDDLVAARETLKLSEKRKNCETKSMITNEIYHAPRHVSVPYPSSNDNDEERQKRLNKKLRTSELAKALREKYGDAPEQEDYHGGTEYGKQLEASRKLSEIEREQTQYEEDNFIRLSTSRQHKKERKRLMQQESSNLAAISDIGNIVRSVNMAFNEKKKSSKNDDDPSLSHRKKKRRSRLNAKNDLQKELLNLSSTKKKK